MGQAMEKPAAAKAAGENQYVTLGIGQDIFAAPVESVLEIVDMRRISRVPEAPASMLGLISLRGRSVPVLDLRIKLGLPPLGPIATSRILVIETVVSGRPLVLGLLADCVIEVLAMDDAEIEPAPNIGVRWRSEYIQGVGRRGSDFIIIFDLPKLLSAEDAAALLKPAEEA